MNGLLGPNSIMVVCMDPLGNPTNDPSSAFVHSLMVAPGAGSSLPDQGDPVPTHRPLSSPLFVA